ncbi:MAG: DUF397 domain-containing protein [Streptosporangiaceae bacterium]
MDLTRAVWHTSSRSGNGGATCVEVAAVWRRSNRSGNSGNTCVEVARDRPDAVAVRDSTNPDGPRLGFARDRWTAFITDIKGGLFDL